MAQEFFKNIIKQDYAKLIILSLLTVAAYIQTFIWMIDRWTIADTYYSHGLLIPMISVFIVWQKREKLSKIKIKPANSGWILFISGISVHIVSALWRVYFTSGFSILLTLAGLILLFLGKDFLKQLWFAVLFLAFMIPLPLVSISHISFKLKVLASQLAVAIVTALGIGASRAGSIIKTRHSYLIVEDPCSGIQSLIALIALGALLAYLSRLSAARKIILFLSSIPVAIFSNAIRITTLTIANEIYGAQQISRAVHDIMGIAVFACAFFVLQILNKTLE